MLMALVRQAAREAPGRAAVISEHGDFTYDECLARSEGVAAGLSHLKISRFGCALTSPHDILAAVVGSSAVGSEACLYPPDLDETGIRETAQRFDHDVVITDRHHPLGATSSLTLPELEASRQSLPPQPDRSPTLILTTGTTGEPRGARHDWSRLVQAVRQREQQSGARWLLAYNLNQFAGVQVLIHGLVSQGTLVSPVTRRADDVVEALRTHAVTHASGTPTFWRMLAGHLDTATARDLRLLQVTLGGEAASQGLIDQLRHLFPAACISHVFAGTEFGSAISVRDGRSGLPLSTLDRGPDSEVQVRIIEGELQIRSRAGMLGYYKRDDVDDDWHATGDLVEVTSDRVNFVGRASEIINVGGAKIHPLPIEEVVCSVDGVELASVYGKSNPVTGQIVAVDVVARPSSDTDELQARIRERCQEQLPPAGRPRRIRVVPELEQRGGKLVRRERMGNAADG